MVEFYVQISKEEYDACIEELKNGAVNFSYGLKACQKVLQILTGEEEEE